MQNFAGFLPKKFPTSVINSLIANVFSSRSSAVPGISNDRLVPGKASTIDEAELPTQTLRFIMNFNKCVVGCYYEER